MNIFHPYCILQVPYTIAIYCDSSDSRVDFSDSSTTNSFLIEYSDDYLNFVVWFKLVRLLPREEQNGSQDPTCL